MLIYSFIIFTSILHFSFCKSKCFIRLAGDDICFYLSDEIENSNNRNIREILFTQKDKILTSIFLETKAINNIDYKILDQLQILLIVYHTKELFIGYISFYEVLINDNELNLIHLNTVEDKCILNSNSDVVKITYEYQLNTNPFQIITNCFDFQQKLPYYFFVTTFLRHLSNCLDVLPTVNIQAGKTHQFSFSQYINAALIGNGEIESITQPDSGVITLVDGTTPSSFPYSKDDMFIYKAEETEGITNLVFQVDSERCQITFQIYKCHSNCKTCTNIGSDTDNQCIDCKNGRYLSGTNCEECDSSCQTCDSATTCLTCPPNMLLENSLCVSNCIQPGNFEYDGQCIDTCPTGKYKHDNTCVDDCTTYNELTEDGECVLTCTPPKIIQEQVCVEQCSSSFYLQENNCVASCKDQLSPNSVTFECENCKTKGEYKKPNFDQCVSDRTGFYIADTQYNYLAPCDPNCKTCDEAPTLLLNKCTGCQDDKILFNEKCYSTCGTNKYFYQGMCVDSCPEGLFPTQESLKKICKNCKDDNMYFYVDKCINDQPPNTYLNDSSLNYLQDCYETCATCDKYGDIDNNNCNTCLVDYYIEYNKPGNCVQNCEMHLYPDNTSPKSCKNCAEDGQVKLEDMDICSDFADLPSNTFLNEDFKDFNFYQYCSEMCATCTKTANIDSNNCITCASGYIKIENTNDCTNKCPQYEVMDSNKCVNCKNLPIPLVRTEDVALCIEKPPHTYIFNTDYNIIKDCYEKCEECSEGGDSTFHKCDKCKEGYYLSSLIEGNCVIRCDYRDYIDEANKKCINCKNENLMKYPNENQCIPIKDGVFYIDEDYGIIKNCSEKCISCSGESNQTNDNCLECRGNFELEVGGNCNGRCKEGYYLYKQICYSDCPDYTVKNEDERKCDKCAEYYLDGKCVGFQPENTYEIVGASTTIKVLAYCYETCAKCDEGGNDEDNKCIQCKIGYFKIDGTKNCVESCPGNLAVDSMNYLCYNCRVNDNGRFKYQGTKSCLATIPDGAILVDKTYNIIQNCFNTCKKCSVGGTSEMHNCDECKDNFYSFILENGNKNCLKVCPKKYFQNNYSYECVNCQTLGQYKYLDQNECLNTLPDNSVVVDSTYNIIETCFERCQECYGPDDTDLIQNCKSCKDGYFLKYNSTNCIPECGEYYYQDLVTKTCINCKKENKYKFKNRNECIDKPDNTIVINNETNIIEECYEACGSCNILGDSLYHNCITCKSGYTPNYYNSSQCEKDCNKRWYFDDKQKYFCTEDLNCVPNRNILVEETSQCVESCYPDSSCILCRTKVLFLDTVAHKCVEECPQGTFKNVKNRECSFIGNDIPCYNYTINTNKTLIDSNLKYFAQQYISTFLYYSQKFVDIIIGSEYILELFYLNECQNEISYKTQLSYIDFKECETFIKNKYGNGSKLVFMKIDMRKISNTNVPNQIEYIAFDSNGNIIDLSLCSSVSNINTTYPIKDKDSLDLETSKQYKEDNIDIFNIEDPFFNDVCFPYYTKDNKDIILRDRRKDIYKWKKFCESDCQYALLDYINNRVNCDCPIKMKYTLDYTDYSNEQKNREELMNKRANNNNFLFIKCCNLVFSNVFGNSGSITILTIIVFQIIFAIIHFVTPKTKLNSIIYRDNSHFVNNPPKNNFRKKILNYQNNSKLDFNKNLLSYKTQHTGSIEEVNHTEKDIPICSNTNKKSTHNIQAKVKTEYELTSKRPLNTIRNSTSVEMTMKDAYLKTIKIIDGEIIDVLPYEESILNDSRKAFEIIGQYMKEKIIIISNLCLISPYESFAFQFILMLFNISLIFCISALLFFQEYVSNRYKFRGEAGFIYLLKRELTKCFFVGLVCSIIIHIETLFLSGRKKIKALKFKITNRELFYKQIHYHLRLFFRKKNLILGICAIIMIILWLYISSFCAVYPKLYIPLIETTFVSALFCMFFQTLFCFIIGYMRYISKTCYNKYLFKTSQILI